MYLTEFDKNTAPPGIFVPNKSGVVIGIDVGGPSKGFHAVALKDGKYWGKYRARTAASVASWCLDTGAQMVGIDAPCRWRPANGARRAERALAADGISCFITPDRGKAKSSSFYEWMLNGEELFHSIEPDFPLFNGSNASGRVCFETFPQAVACALAGTIVSAKQKSVQRRKILQAAGLDISSLTNIDTVDAALCALTAHCLLADRFKTYGDVESGFIVVPA